MKLAEKRSRYGATRARGEVGLCMVGLANLYKETRSVKFISDRTDREVLKRMAQASINDD